MYSLRDYGEMLADEERFEAYRKAITKAVRAGDTVLEIGCGPGVFALLACRAGAKKVYAVETEDVVQIARQIAAANGLADQIEFIQGDSRKLQLPERVNVIVSDIRGVLPLYDQAIATIEDARQRFLAPGGILIPQSDTLKAAVVEATQFYSRLTAPWDHSALAMDLSASLPFLMNASYGVQFKGEQLLTETLSWYRLDYTSGASSDVAGDLAFNVRRVGMAHGLCVWFESQLFEGTGYSSNPKAASNVYGQIFFPWPEAVSLERGQEIQVRLQASLVGDDYVWRWETKISNNGAVAARHFRQCTFDGALLSPTSLRRRSGDFVPELSESGQADRWMLQAMDGKASLQEIAQAAAQHYPRIFRCLEDALRRAADLAAEFSR